MQWEMLAQTHAQCLHSAIAQEVREQYEDSQIDYQYEDEAVDNFTRSFYVSASSHLLYPLDITLNPNLIR